MMRKQDMLEPQKSSILSDPSLLIVEDEPRLRELLVRAVAQWNVGAHAVRTAEEALKHLETHRADILLLDINLPGMSGLELLRTLRERGSKVQAIVLTGFGDLEAAKLAIRLDVVDFLTKPFHLGDLEVAIDRARKRLMPPRPELGEAGPPPPFGDTPEQTLEELERRHILAALERNRGNRTATAEELGISRRTLQYRIAEYVKKGWLRPSEE
jgi:DNA-binding NtrC family response regulator